MTSHLSFGKIIRNYVNETNKFRKKLTGVTVTFVAGDTFRHFLHVKRILPLSWIYFHSDPMGRILRVYQSLIIKFPISTQAIQTGLLMGTGDVIAQTFVEKKPLNKINFVRTGQFTIVGTVFVGPPLRIWYGVLEKFFGNQGKTVALKKVATDQLIFAPVFIGFIMGVLSLVQGNSTQEVTQRLTNDYPSVLVNNYKLWPAVQLINFYIVPLQYQVLTVQFVAILWNTYLSWKMNQHIQ